MFHTNIESTAYERWDCPSTCVHRSHSVSRQDFYFFLFLFSCYYSYLAPSINAITLSYSFYAILEDDPIFLNLY